MKRREGALLAETALALPIVLTFAAAASSVSVTSARLVEKSAEKIEAELAAAEAVARFLSDEAEEYPEEESALVDGVKLRCLRVPTKDGAGTLIVLPEE